MLHKIARDVFVEAIKRAARVAPSSESKPLLTNVLIEFKQQEAILIATDLDIAVVARCPKEEATEEEEKVCVNAKQLLDIAQAVEGNSISILVDPETNATISSGAFNAQLPVMDFSSFPSVEEWEDEGALDIPIGPLVEGVNRCAFSIADNEAKMNLMAVRVGDGFIQATDGSVTTVVEYEFDSGEILIPAQAVKDLLLTLKSSVADSVQVRTTDSFIMFKVDDSVFLTRRSTASFPDIINRVLKVTDDLPEVVKVDASALRRAFVRVGITSNDRSRAVVCKFEGENLNISSFNQAGASSQETVKVESLQEDPLDYTLLFNGDYVVDILKSANIPEVTLKFNTNIRFPVRFEGSEMKALLMRLSDAMCRLAPAEDDKSETDNG